MGQHCDNHFFLYFDTRVPYSRLSSVPRNHFSCFIIFELIEISLAINDTRKLVISTNSKKICTLTWKRIGDGFYAINDQY